jgi:8-oxo-dGTP pyrophosphatase MutT (NUDIX family)
MIPDASLIIPLRNNRILLQLRDQYAINRPNMWAFFGGAVKNNESPLEAAIRELYEELKVNINLTYITSIIRKKSEGNFKKHLFTFDTVFDESYFKTRLSEGKDTRYFSLTEINYLANMKNSDKTIAQIFFNIYFNKLYFDM